MKEIDWEIWRRNARLRAWASQLPLEGIWQSGVIGSVLRMGCRKCKLVASGWRNTHPIYQLSTTLKLVEIECAKNLGRAGCPHLISLQNPNPDPREIQTLTQLELLLDTFGIQLLGVDRFEGYKEWYDTLKEKSEAERSLEEEFGEIWELDVEKSFPPPPLLQTKGEQAQLLVPETKPRPRILEPDPGDFLLRMEIAPALRARPPLELPEDWILSREEFLNKVRESMQSHYASNEIKESDLGDASFYLYADVSLERTNASWMLKNLPMLKAGLELLAFLEHNIDDGDVMTLLWQKNALDTP